MSFVEYHPGGLLEIAFVYQVPTYCRCSFVRNTDTQEAPSLQVNNKFVSNYQNIGIHEPSVILCGHCVL